MAMRVIASEVRQIMENCTLDDPTVDAYIVGANALINSILGTSNTTLMKEIEKWLTAHMIANSKQRQGAVEKLGDAQITYTGKWGEMLKSTSYGQMVLTLDGSGLLARAGKQAVTVYAIPTQDFD